MNKPPYTDEELDLLQGYKLIYSYRDEEQSLTTNLGGWKSKSKHFNEHFYAEFPDYDPIRMKNLTRIVNGL